MRRTLAVAAALLALAPAGSAQDAIAPETLAAIKKATAFIKVEVSPQLSGSGSGFVVQVEGDKALVVTNHHVAVPRPAGAGLKPPVVTVVFDSGSGLTERSAVAEIVAVDKEQDLAVLKVTGVKDLPRPISYTDAPKPVETMQVYSFGFPFGQVLSTAKNANPAVTVGKASVSSLRLGDDGELALVQIDGAINPGNSGGPVVDARGRLVGVAVATIKDSTGIGLTIPAAEVIKMMRGRLGPVKVVRKKDAAGKPTARIEVELIDPTGSVRGATAHYLALAPKAAKPAGNALDKVAGSKRVALAVTKNLAFAEIALDAADGSLLVQAVLETGADRQARAGAVRSYSLAPAAVGPAEGGKPPDGWKEYAVRDGSFSVWVPVANAPVAEQERATVNRGQRMKVTALGVPLPGGVVGKAELIALPAAFIRVPRREVADMFRAALMSENKGTLASQNDVRLGVFAGKEYAFENGTTLTRTRIFVSGTRVFLAEVSGPKEEAEGPTGGTFLASFHVGARPPVAVATTPPNGTTVVPQPPAAGRPPLPPKSPPAVVAGPQPTSPPAVVTRPGPQPKMLGLTLDPPFQDDAPAGAVLVGLEVSLTKFLNNDAIKGYRPIYRLGDRESFGEQRGSATERVTALKAKAGYAVGAISVSSGLNLDGLSLTFMKHSGDRLEATDAYDSPKVGNPKGNPSQQIVGDGTPVVGVVGCVGKKGNANAIGLLFRGRARTGEPAGDPKR